jgi:hypothetical protein
VAATVATVPGARAEEAVSAAAPPLPGAPAAPVCPAVPASSGERVERLAIVLGSNTGKDSGLEKLRYADDDAVAAYDLATELGYRTILLTDLDPETRARVGNRYDFARPPTRQELKAAIADQLAEAGRARERSGGPVEVRMLVWISAHGDQNGSLFFKDGRYPRLALAEDLFAATDRARVDLDFILDSCWPRAVVGRGGDRAALTQAHARARWQADLDSFPRVGVLLAQTGDGEALEWSKLASGVFSFLVRSALRGAADVNGDGRITYTEVEAFAQSATGAIGDPSARLQVRAFLPRETQDRVLGDWSVVSSPPMRLRLPAEEGIRIRIAAPDAGILVETHKGPEENVCADVVLRLPTRVATFEVTQMDPTGSVRGRFGLRRIVDRDALLADLSADTPPIAARGEDEREAALTGGLFHDSFDERSYRDWTNARGRVWDQVDTTTLVEEAERHATHRTWAWALIGAGAVAAVGGVAAYAVADASYRDWTTAVGRGDTANASRLESRTHQYDVLATIGFGLAGALAATGTGILFWDFREGRGAPGAQPNLAFRCQIGALTATCGGRF